MKKNISKKILALICALSVAFTSISVPYGNKAEAAAKTTFASSKYATWERVTFSELGFADGTYTNLKDGKIGVQDFTLDGKVISGDIRFEGVGTYVVFGGTGTNWSQGLQIYTLESGDLLLKSHMDNSTTTIKQDVVGTSATLVGGTFNLKLSYELVNGSYDTDAETKDTLVLGLWINDTLYNNQYINFNVINPLGLGADRGARYTKGIMSILVPTSTDDNKYSITLSTSFEDSAYADWNQVSFEDYGKEGYYGYNEWQPENTGSSGIALTDKVFHGNIQFPADDSQSYLALGDIWTDAELLWISSNGEQMTVTGVTDALDPNIAGTKLIGTELNLKLTYDVYDSDGDKVDDALKLGVWINNILYNNKYIEIADSYPLFIGAGMYLSNITVSTPKPEEIPAIEFQDSEYVGWQQVTFSNYGVEDNKAYSGGNDFWCDTDRANKVFNGNVQLSSVYYSHINMGNANNEVGFIVTSNEGQVNFAIMAGEAHPIAPEVGTEFNLKLSYHVLDNNDDGEGDALKLGVWINNKLYNNQYFEVEDYGMILDPWMGITANADDPTTVSSAKDEVYFQDTDYKYWEQITFGDFMVADGTYDTTRIAGYNYRSTLEGKVFNGNVTFSEDSAWQIRIGGGTSYDTGMYLYSYGQGKLLVGSEEIPTSVVRPGTEFNYKLSFDIVTEDETTYLKLGVWFNNVLYKYFEIPDYAENVGRYLCIEPGTGSVTIESDIPTSYNMADIAVPETGIVNPPVVVQKVTSVEKYEALATNGAAIAIIDVDASLNLLDASGNIMKDASDENITAYTFLEDYRATVIPAFHIDSEEEAEALLVFLKRYNPFDSYVIADSENVAHLNKVRTAYTQIGAILEYDESLDKAGREASRRLANNNMVSTILLPEGSVNVDIVNEYNIRMFNVWSYASDKAGIYEGIVSGYNGMVSSDAAAITAVYESITVPTLSGKPQAVGHAGYNQSVYPANTITAFEAAKAYGASGIEIDPQQTSDGYIVLSHDNGITDINGTPYTISQTSLEDLKTITMVSGDGNETGKICTLEEAIAWAQENDMVVYIHMNRHNLVDAYDAPVKELGMEDNVVAFARPDLVNGGLGNYLAWYNNSDISTIGGGRLVIDPATNKSAMDNVEHALYTLIKVCRVVNDQNMPLDAYDLQGDIAKDDTFYYQMSARGFLGLHSQVFDQNLVDKWMITGAGLTTALFDYPSMINDYLVDIDVEDAIYEIGQNIELKQTVKRIKGADAIIDCGIEQVAGADLTKSGDNYTMNTAGTATVVYYADVTLERGDEDLTYRLYSEPVEITFAEDTDIHFANTKYAEWDRLTFSSYNLDLNLYDGVHAYPVIWSRSAYGICASSSVTNAMEGKVFSGEIAFSDANAILYLGASSNPANTGAGIRLERNKTVYAKGLSLYAQGQRYDIDPDIAGVDLVENEFDLKVSFEVVTNPDETKYLKLGVFFNGKLYNNEYIEISTWEASGVTYTYEEYLGRYICIQTPGASSPNSYMSIASDNSEVMNIFAEITDSIAMNYVVKTTCNVAPTMTFTLEGSNESITVEGKKSDKISNTWDEYTFQFPGIKPQDMAKKITATLKVGSAYTRTWEYSVMDYCQQLLKVQEASGLTTTSGTAYTDAQLAALKELVVDLIEYGTEVQNYGAHRGQLGAINEADLLANILENAVPGYDGYDQASDTELGELAGVVGAKLTGTVSDEVALYKWTGATLAFKDTIQIRGRFKLLNEACAENLKMMVSVDGAEATEYDFTATPYGSQGEYYVDFSDIYATDFSKTISITFYSDGVAVGNILNYSVNTYLDAKRSTSDTYLEKLLLAINGYGNAAVAFKAFMTSSAQ